MFCSSALTKQANIVSSMRKYLCITILKNKSQFYVNGVKSLVTLLKKKSQKHTRAVSKKNQQGLWGNRCVIWRENNNYPICAVND